MLRCLRGAIGAGPARVVRHRALLLGLHGGGQANYRGDHRLELKNQEQETREQPHGLSVLDIDHRYKFCSLTMLPKSSPRPSIREYARFLIFTQVTQSPQGSAFRFATVPSRSSRCTASKRARPFSHREIEGGMVEVASAPA